MKKNLLFLLCALLPAVYMQAQYLTVGSYNIRNDNAGDARNGNGWQQRCPVIAQLLTFNDFDIWGSQEVLHNQLEDMLQAMPQYDYIGVGRDDGQTKGEYAPIFYKKDKFRLLKSGNFWMAEDTTYPNKGWDAALPRICTWGQFRDKEGKFNFWFFNLHMDHVGVEARRESAKLVLARIKEMCGKDPVILTGDFNVDQTNESYHLLNESGILRDSYEDAPVKYALNGTFNAWNANLKSDSRIDHIFISPNFTAERYGILTDTYRLPKTVADSDPQAGQSPKTSPNDYEARLPSDHFPVKVILKFSRR